MKTYSIYSLLLCTFFILAGCKKNSGGDNPPVVSPPSVSGINPTSGPKNTAVTISGNNFGTDAGKVAVSFNGLAATVQSVTNTQIVALVPAKANTGIVKVTVNAQSVDGLIFTYIPTVIVSTVAGNGLQGYIDATGSAARFNYPVGVSADSAGNLYVIDQSNTVRKINSGGAVSTVAGSNGLNGYVDATGAGARFNSLNGISLDPSGAFMYAGDPGNNAIRKITSNGTVTTYAHSLIQDLLDGPLGSAHFDLPDYLTADINGNVYFSDFGNRRIRKITPAGIVSSLAGGGSSAGVVDGTGTAATIKFPLGIAADAQGNIYYTENNNNSVRKITPAGEVKTLAGGTQGFADGTGTAAQFYTPFGICVDNAGNIYVADHDNNRIRKITQAGIVTTIAGNDGQGYKDGDGTIAYFNNPDGMTIDKDGNLYVADTRNHAIRKITVQ
jgi:serine/threonine protein kinase, bacterial